MDKGRIELQNNDLQSNEGATYQPYPYKIYLKKLILTY
jgi:hypothetical protein